MSFQSSAFQSGAFQLEVTGAGAGQGTCVITGQLSATLNGTTDFTKSGFGTPDAAIIITCGAASGANPTAVGRFSAGLWDGTNQRAGAVAMSDNQVSTVVFRSSSDGHGAIICNPATTNTYYTVSAITDGIRLTNSVDNTTSSVFCTVILIAGIDSSLITFTPNATQNGTQVSASLGFAPKAVVFVCIGSTTADADGVTSCNISFGAATVNGTHRALFFSSTNAVSDEQANILYSESRCVGQINADAITWTAEITTWGADTFTMTTRDGATGSDLCFALALGGDDLSLVLGTFTTPTSTGVATVPTTGITPESVIIALSTATGTTLETDDDANGYLVGALDTDVQAAHNFSTDDAAATTDCNSRYSATVPVLLDAAGATTIIQADLDSLDGDGFDLNYSTVDSTARKGWFLAFGPPFVAGGFVPYPRPRGKIGGMSSWSGGMHP